MKRITLSILVTLATLATILILWELRSIVLLFIVSLAVAAAFHDPVKRMRRAKLSRSIAMTIAYGVTLLALLGLALLVSLPLSMEVEQLIQESVQRYDQLYQAKSALAEESGNDNWQADLWATLPPIDELDSYLPAESSNILLSSILGLTQGIVGIAGQLLLALALSVYWTADEVHFERLWLSLLPPTKRRQARNLWRTLEGNIGAYLRSEVLQSVIVGALLTAGFYLMGLNYPFLIATAAAISWFIPLIGGVIGLIFVVILALFNGFWLTIAAALYTIVVFLLMEYVVEPRIYRRDHYSSILVILVMLAMLYALGLLGLLIAPPIALVIQVIMDELFLPSAATMQRAEKAQQQEESLSRIRRRIRTLQETLSQNENPSPRLKNLSQRLETLATDISETRVEQYLKERRYR